MGPMGVALLASFFFSFTFLLNDWLHQSGGNWLWTASLRYFWMLPMLFAVVYLQKGHLKVWQNIKAQPLPWFVWSTVGFGFFYAGITLASLYAPAWLVASTWQVTIVAGTLISPFVRSKGEKLTRIPLWTLVFSGIILLGVFLIQWQHLHRVTAGTFWLGLLSALVAAVSYPLGNRQMMRHVAGRLRAPERIYGMTLVSMPFWLVLSGIGLYQSGLPSRSAVVSTFGVAMLSGVVATTLFFKATDAAQGDVFQLGAVEATQSAQVLFTVLGGVLWLGARWPTLYTWVGLLLIVVGMAFHALFQKHARDIEIG